MGLWSMMMAAWIGLTPTGLAGPGPPEKCAGRVRILPHAVVRPCELAPAPATLSPGGLLALLATHRSAFLLDVTVDRHDGGGYAVGEPLHLRGTSAEAGYLHLLQRDSSGGVRLLPSSLWVGAGQSFQLRFVLSGPPGPQRLRAVITQRPLALSHFPANASVELLGRFAQDEVLFCVEPALSTPSNP